MDISNNTTGANQQEIPASNPGYGAKSRNGVMNPEARDAMDKFKMEAASEVGVDLKPGYNGHLTSREAGSVGGQMVKKMIKAYEDNMQ